MPIIPHWNTELLNIEDTERRERELKPAAHIEIRPRSPITAREEIGER